MAQALFEWLRWIGGETGGGGRGRGFGREDGKVTAGWMRELGRWMDGWCGRDGQGQVVKLAERPQMGNNGTMSKRRGMFMHLAEAR